jgi:hypothetical protein
MMRSSTYLVNASETNIRVARSGPGGYISAGISSGGLFQFRLDEIKMEIGKIISHLYSIVTSSSQYYVFPLLQNRAAVCRTSL